MMEREGGANEWSVTHKSKFEVDKFGPVHLTQKVVQDPNNPNKTIPMPRPDLHLTGHTITPSTSCKFLGVHVDQKLDWKEQSAYALGKGEKYTAQMRRLAQKRCGVPGRLGCRLHNGVVLTKMLYAVEVWCSPILPPKPGHMKRQGSVGFATKLATVQWQSTLFISGAM